MEQKRRAVIYCRVSTKEQVEEGNSLSTQEKNCKEYAQKNGYEVAAIFVEQGESAKTADRTELKKLMSFCAIRKNDIKAVISYKIDRISRNTDDYSQIRLLLKRYGVEIKSTSEHFEDTPAGRFMENIIANVAQFDNDVRAERSIGGMRDAVREGRYVWMAPFGYSNVRVNGKSTIAPNHLAHWVRKIFEEIAFNKGNPEETRKKLIMEGLLNERGVPISRSTFYNILRKEIYTGWTFKFGERNKGSFEPIISEEIFHQVQQVLSKKNGKPKHYLSQNPDFPLRRFFHHPSGKAFTGCWSKGRDKKYPYYMIHRLNVSFRKEVLENMFKNWLNQFAMDIGNFDSLLSFIKAHIHKGVMTKEADSEKLQKRISDLKAKQATLIDKNIEGVITNELCRERVAAIDEELFQSRKAIANLPSSEINYPRLLELIRDVLLNPGDLWERLHNKQKIKLQWFFFPNGIEFDGLESRTTKICRLFKLKVEVSPFQSYVVHHPKPKSNTSNLQISLPFEDTTSVQSDMFWCDLKEEIVTLTEILSTDN